MRITGRQFPDADQLAAAAATFLNQSTVTFSGGKGTVLLIFGVQVRNAAATNINSLVVQNNGTAIAHTQMNGVTWMDAVVGRIAVVYCIVVFKDPPAGSTARAQINQSASTLDILAASGRVLVVAFPEDGTEGPIVTVA